MDLDDLYEVSRPSSPSESLLGSQSTQPNLRKASIAFKSLPDEIIEQILRLSDPNSFASLILLNSKWRQVSQQLHLYTHQLAGCRHDIVIPPFNGDTSHDLDRLKEMFVREVKRNLYDAYLRPKETVISLVSTSISSSAAFPGGEAFHFSFSPNGRYILAWSSSRIYVVNATKEELEVERELKILRRPVSATILNDGSLLAVLSTDHQVDLYELASSPPRHIRAVALDHAPRTIALSPDGAVLAAAYDGGVEVYSLSPGAAVTDRRAVKCDAADYLTFSEDGTELLGTTIHSKDPSTVILTAPYFDPGDALLEDTISQLWTTSIIFPNSSRDCSHAVLLPSSADDESNWTFTYDRVFETFRAVKVDDLRNGTTYFTGPVGHANSIGKLLPCTLPTATKTGDLVSAGFQGCEIWIYGVPRDKTAIPEIGHAESDSESTPGNVTRMSSSASSRSQTRLREGSLNGRIPQWQALCNKNRNMFIEGRKVGSLVGINAVKWVTKQSTSNFERLIGVAPGVVGHQIETDEDGIPPIDGGRLVLLDFEYGPSNGMKRYITIEVGEKAPEALEEERRDIEAEVAIVRRRTVAQKRGSQSGLLRSTTLAGPRPAGRAGNNLSSMPPLPPMPASPPEIARSNRLASTSEERSGSISVEENDEVMDMPYAQGQPRSADTLRRAATAAAVNRRLHPPRVVPQEDVVFRRADGREEHPHESDADNWVPPPPPYSRDPIAPLPEHLRNAILAGSVPVAHSLRRSSTQRTTGSEDSDIFSSLSRSRTTYLPRTNSSRRASLANGRTRSASTVTSRSSVSQPSMDVLSTRPASTQSAGAEVDDIYDVSPPGTPPFQPARPTEGTSSHLIPRRPIGTSKDQASTALPSTEQSRNYLEEPPTAPPTHVSPPISPPPLDATLSQPISPIPEIHASSNTSPQQSSLQGSPSIPSRLDIVSFQDTPPRLTEKREAAAGHKSRPLSTSAPNVNRLQAELPPRPNEDHRMSGPPVSQPDADPQVSPEASPPSQSHASIILAQAQVPERAVVAGVAAPMTAIDSPIHDNPVENFQGPSAAQLARLSTRSGRPNFRVLTDPSRRASGTYSPQHLPPNQFVPSLDQSRGINPTEMVPLQSPSRAATQRVQVQNIHVPARIAMSNGTGYSPEGFNGPAGFYAAVNQPTFPPAGNHGQGLFFNRNAGTRRGSANPLGSMGADPVARLGMNEIRYNASTPDLRPRHPGRMDTIHSITSTGEGHPGDGQGTTMLTSKSKAGKGTKRRAWGTRKAKQEKQAKVDVSIDEGVVMGQPNWSQGAAEFRGDAGSVENGKDKKDKKCVVM